MKTKKNLNQLVFNKTTVSNLNNVRMDKLLGGNMWTTNTEPSLDPATCTSNDTTAPEMSSYCPSQVFINTSC
jgi:hypothetical protein